MRSHQAKRVQLVLSAIVVVSGWLVALRIATGLLE
jgi:hypothetical protein